MEKKKIVYEIILSIWNLAKEHGFEQLTDEQWEHFCNEANELRNNFLQYGEDADLLFRDMYKAIQNYYERKDEHDNQSIFNRHQ